MRAAPTVPGRRPQRRDPFVNDTRAELKGGFSKVELFRAMTKYLIHFLPPCIQLETPWASLSTMPSRAAGTALAAPLPLAFPDGNLHAKTSLMGLL